MKVRFATDVLDSEETWDTLDRIVYYFGEGRHFWDTDNLEEIESSQWMQIDLSSRYGRRKMETFQKCCTDAIYPPTTKMHTIALLITQEGNSETELSPEEAIRCLEAPAYVAVENAASDGSFLFAMIHAFGRRELLDAHSDAWWRIEHMGGYGEVERTVERIRVQTTGPLRAFVLADSDRLYPGHQSSTIQKIEGYCTTHSVPYAILRKRKIENYLPISAIRSESRRFQQTRNAFLNLKAEQQDHYEMKSGFRTDDRGRAIVPDEQRCLFQHVPQRILDGLCGGFGGEVWRRFESDRNVITEDNIGLICQADPTEIDQILDHIEELL